MGQSHLVGISRVPGVLTLYSHERGEVIPKLSKKIIEKIHMITVIIKEGEFSVRLLLDRNKTNIDLSYALQYRSVDKLEKIRSLLAMRRK